jgi:hypothetical protein
MTEVPLPFDVEVETPLPKPNPVKAEKDRLGEKARRVLAYLQEHGSAVNWRLSIPELGGSRAVGRIWELQQAGYDIRKEHVAGGTWPYRYYGLKSL